MKFSCTHCSQPAWFISYQFRIEHTLFLGHSHNAVAIVKAKYSLNEFPNIELSNLPLVTVVLDVRPISVRLKLTILEHYDLLQDCVILF